MSTTEVQQEINIGCRAHEHANNRDRYLLKKINIGRSLLIKSAENTLMRFFASSLRNTDETSIQFVTTGTIFIIPFYPDIHRTLMLLLFPFLYSSVMYSSEQTGLIRDSSTDHLAFFYAEILSLSILSLSAIFVNPLFISAVCRPPPPPHVLGV